MGAVNTERQQVSRTQYNLMKSIHFVNYQGVDHKAINTQKSI